MSDYLFDSNPKQYPPRIKSLPASSTIFTLEAQMLHRDLTLHCVRWLHALCEAPTAVGHFSTLRGRRHVHCKGASLSNFLESPTLASQGHIAHFCAIGGDQAHCTFAPLGDLYHQTSPIHTTKFEAWLWYQLKDLWHHPKRLAFSAELVKSLYTQDHPHI